MTRTNTLDKLPPGIRKTAKKLISKAKPLKLQGELLKLINDLVVHTSKGKNYKGVREPTKFKGFDESHTIKPNGRVLWDAPAAMAQYRPALLDYISSFSDNVYTSMKMNASFRNWYYHDKTVDITETNGLQVISRISKDTVIVRKYESVLSMMPTFTIRNKADARAAVDQTLSRAVETIEKFTQQQSGAVFMCSVQAHINLVKFGETRGSEYFKFDDYISKKKAVWNPQNTDDKCFIYSLAIGIDQNEIKKKKRLAKFQPKHSIQLQNLTEIILRRKLQYSTPVEVGDTITQIEDDIKTRINIWEYTNNSFKDGELPIQTYASKKTLEYKDVINLLLVHDEELNLSHYAYIKNIRAFENSKRTDHSVQDRCDACGQWFKRKVFKNHVTNRCATNSQITNFPKPGKKIMESFTSFEKQTQQPFAIYADLESSMKEVDVINGVTSIMALHEPNSYYYIFVNCLTNEIVHKRFYRAETGVVRHFIDTLKKDCEEVYNKYYSDNPNLWRGTPEEEALFKSQSDCHICNKHILTGHEKNEWERINNKKYPDYKVRDHCHIEKKFRGAAHNLCNLKHNKRTPFFPVYFHNGNNYDWHFFYSEIKDGGIDCDEISPLALNSEKFLIYNLKYHDKYIDKEGNEHTKTKYEIHLKDSMNFMASSLDSISKSLPPSAFHYTRELAKEFSHIPNAEEALSRKGIYPYCWMNDYKKFEATSLPSFEDFHSELSSQKEFFEDLSEIQKQQLRDDHAHAVEMYNRFECKNFAGYHETYLKKDVHLLADVFSQHVALSLRDFGIDPHHFPTLASQAYQCMLKKTKVQLPLIQEDQSDMFLHFEKNKRGGNCTPLEQRYAEANNPYLKDYDPSKPTSSILFGDVNGLYSQPMSNNLPNAPGEYASDSEIQSLNDGDLQQTLQSYLRKPCFIEVSGYVPDEFHDHVNPYPFFPRKMKITDDMLSPTQLQIKQELNISSGECEKLVQTLLPVKLEMVHSKLLKLFVDHGFKVTEVHSVIHFEESSWMKPYIDFCLHQRAKATSDFEKSYYKNMCNIIFGKTIENKRDRSRTIITSDQKKYQRFMNQPNTPVATHLSEDVVCIMTPKASVTLDNPIYVGCAILDLSKFLMYDYYFNILKPKYGDKVKLLYTDTDSFIIHIECEDIYEDMRDDYNLNFDLSDYPDDHPMFQGWCAKAIKGRKDLFKKIPGCLKDEVKGNPIRRSVALRAKCYSVEMEVRGDLKYKNTCKGTPRGYCEALGIEDYLKCFTDNVKESGVVFGIQSHGHTIGTERQSRDHYNSFDDKRYMDEDRNTLRAHGHYLNK